MLEFLLKRIFLIIITIWVIVTISFFVARLAPGSPFSGERAVSPDVLNNIKKAYNLDKPLYIQYVNYLGNILVLDLGPSFQIKDFTVNELLKEAVPISASIGLFVVVVSVIFGFILGSIAALNQHKLADYSIVVIILFFLAIPSFVLAPLAQLFFGVILKWFPVTGWFGPSYMILPLSLLTLNSSFVFARIFRNSMLETIHSNYIRTAYAKGLSYRYILTKHAFKSAFLPALSLLGPILAGIMTGSLIVETVFNIPGMGRYLVQATTNRDYSLLMGCIIVYSVLLLVLTLIVDILYHWLDPRINLNK